MQPRILTTCAILSLVQPATRGCYGDDPDGKPTKDDRVIALPVGTLFVPDSVGAGRQEVDLLVHFHGAQNCMRPNFKQAGIDGVLVVVNFNGLSTAYSKPFQDVKLFQQILDDATATMRHESVLTAEGTLGHVCVSSFSAGYGAVREILKQPKYFDRVNGILAADSIYAGLNPNQRERRVDPQNMKDFRRFAQEAADGRKTFIVTHSQLVTPYASTFETADDLLRFVDLDREATEIPGPGAMRQVSRAHAGAFTVLGYAGVDGPAHMEHLRHIGHWLRMLPLKFVITTPVDPGGHSRHDTRNSKS